MKAKYLWYFGDLKSWAARSTITKAKANPLKALDFAEGNIAYLFEDRKIIGTLNAEKILRKFACDCALDVLHLWPDVPSVVKEYLITQDESLRAAAWDTARAAAWAAARDAARAAAWDTARATAWAAARDAARAAAWDTARATAWDTARATAWAAARDAAWDTARATAWDTARDAAWDTARATAWAAARDAMSKKLGKLLLDAIKLNQPQENKNDPRS